MPRAVPPEPLRFHLSPSVQCFLGINLALCLAALAIACLGWGRLSSQLVDFDEIEPAKRTFRVDLNTATWQELAQLPGIGITLGQRIQTLRSDRGPFTSLQQLLEVKGIGPRVLERISPFLVLREVRGRQQQPISSSAEGEGF